MCWSETASIVMVGVGTAATFITARKGESPALWVPIGYYTVMEALQAFGYSVIDECGSNANATLAYLLYLHIAFQPVFISAFVMALAPSPVPDKTRKVVYELSAIASLILLARLLPSTALGPCFYRLAMCGETACVSTGTWHLAWEVPLNNLFGDFANTYLQYPEYFLVLFLMPLLYGSWRFVVFHFFAGPLFAHLLTNDVDEMPAIWCLFSVGIMIIGLSPYIRGKVFKAATQTA